MSKLVTAFAFSSLALTSFAAAGELRPGSGHSIRLERFTGSVYYLADPDGHRVVATLASGAEDQPIRFVSTLEPGQRMLISVPRALGKPSLGFDIQRDGDTIRLTEPSLAVTHGEPDEVASRAQLGE
jgi:hypothetical protein